MIMLSEYIADSVIKFVEDKLLSNDNGHDLQHIERVINNASKIIIGTKASKKIVYTSIYLHDLIDYKVTNNEEEELKQIIEVLNNANYSKQEINEIVDIISSISYSKFKKLTTINQQVVSDADKLDALGTMGIIRTIQYGQSVGRPFYEDDNLLKVRNHYIFGKSTKTSLSHFYDKLLKLPYIMYTKEGKKLARKRVKILKQFLNSFYEELK